MTRTRRRAVGLGGLLLLAALALATPLAAEELALIDDIVVDGESPEEPSAENLTIVVAAKGASETGRRGMGLSAGDEVRTGEGVQAVLRFLNLDSEVDPLVFVDESSTYEITGPTTLTGLFGRLFASVAGLFSVITPAGRLGVEGTEFDVLIDDDGGVDIRVLEGVVAFEPAAVEEDPGAGGEERPPPAEPTEPSSTGGSAIRVELPTDTSKTVEMDLTVSNGCPEPERFFIESPEALPWVQIAAVPQPVEVPPDGSAAAATVILVNAAGVVPGTYPGEIVLRCEQCADCTITRSSVPLEIEVLGAVGEREARAVADAEAESREAGGESPASLRIEALERVSLKGDVETAAPEKMAETEVVETLRWTDDVFVAVQPTYAAEGDAPHFDSVDERSREFRAARYDAVWQDDPDARAKLGNVYKDWGEDRRASKQYEQAAEKEPELARSADFVASWAEANRRAGRLEKAAEQAQQAFELDPSSSHAHVARGNVYRNLASQANEVGDEAREKIYLDLAVESYRVASDSSAPRPEDKARRLRGVAETNLAQAYTALAKRALEKGATEEADRQLAEAQKAVAAAEAVYAKSENPFLYLAEGQVLQQRARLAKARGDETASRQELAKAKQSYEAALTEHADLAPAHYLIATVYEDQGDTEQAEAELEKAVEKQPTYSPSYKSLSRLKEIERPGAGTVYLNRDLKLVPKAVLIEPGAGTVPVPDLAGMARRDAEKTIAASGFVVGQVSRRPSAGTVGSVASQSPAPGSRAVKGAAIDLVLAVPAGSFRMPDLRGLELEAAQERLVDHGLRLSRVERKEKKGRKRTEVTGHSPRPGARVSSGKTVVLEVTEPKRVKVPDLVGRSHRDAAEKLEKEGFVAGEVTRERSCSDAGLVLRQSPEKGTRLMPGSGVAFVVSAPPGADGREVPDLFGAERRRAESLLSELGFRIGPIDEQESERPAGSVIAQRPAARTVLYAGCAVALTVARPVALVEVPNLVGESLAELQRSSTRAALAAAGVELGRVVYVSSRQYRHGTVLAQSPPAGSRVRRGTRIDVQVARRIATPPPPPPQSTVSVPNLECKRFEQAVAILKEMGLRYSTSGQGPHVVRQSPAAGSRVQGGSVIKLHLYACPG